MVDFQLTISMDFQFLLLTRLPVTRWVKLSLNFELLVPKYREIKFLLGQRILKNIFMQLELFRIQETNKEN